MLYQYLFLFLFLIAAMYLSVRLNKLTIAASLAGGFLSLFLFAGAGYVALILMAAFFVLGTAATSWKIKTKLQLGLAEIDKGKRNAAQVIANAGVPAILALIACFFPSQKNVFSLMIAAAFASATADTLSSELGNIYGTRFYNIITFKQDKRGLNGVVSIEGTLFGIVGSILVALLYTTAQGFSIKAILWITVAGTAGNFADSIIGATAERKNLVGNNVVNFLNTFIASIVALMLFVISNK